ncbi:MAG: AarF/UbiB family protein [Coriobacteriales bacterium]|nr:AarF/UbiB family protein [Coriobacteriales bacterium]
MAGFISALVKQRRDSKKATPSTSGRLKEIVDIIRKYDYEGGITPQILVGIIQDLGPTFVKIGQIASQQSDYIPEDYRDALAQLRSSVAPMDLETVYAQIQKHLGKPVDELFATFDDKPLGSASIGQVHRAELFDGTIVAVKVRRPGVVDTVARDFALLENVINTFLKNGVGGIDVKSLIKELEKTSKNELDFTHEAGNLETFWENNEGRPGVLVPRCYRELTNEAILTEDFAVGTEVSDIAYLDSLDDEERDRLAALVADNFATQILVDGFYHADPHSGNVLIKEPDPVEVAEDAEDDAAAEDTVAAEDAPVAETVEDGAPEEAEEGPKLPEHSIEWIDFGMMGVLTQQQRQVLLDLVTAIVMQDAYALKRAVLKAAQPQGEINHGAMLELCEGMCEQYTGSDLGDFDLADLLGTIIGNLQDESFDIDPFLTNLARGIIAVEGTVRTLSPRVNILNCFIDKVEVGAALDLDFANMDKEQLAGLNGPIAMELMKFLKSVSQSSAKTAETLDMLEKGQVKVRTDLGFEERALAAVERIAGCAIRALMIIALFIGSCLLCTVPVTAMETRPLLVAFPVLGSIGYVVSVFFAWRLYKSMKSGK